MRYTGLFYVKNQRALQGVHDAPYHMLGRHALCAEGCETDGGAIACAHGRLRNGARLREELAQGGLRVPEEGGAARVVLHAYRMWGEEYPAHLEGPVTTAVIDQDAGRLVLSRDRMGELPVFYAAKGCSVAFSDHPDAVLRSPVASRVMDRQGLCELFGLGPARTPGLTPLRDVRALEPGCALLADERGVRLQRYFTWETRPHEDDETRTVQTTRSLIERAVNDVRALDPAVMLSGGLDSTVLAAILCNGRDAPVDAWSVDYEDNARYFRGGAFQPEEDAPYADKAARLFGAKHRRVTLSQEALANALTEAMLLRGFPGMADIDASLLLFAREIGRERAFALSGECADEVFGGYPWFSGDDAPDADAFPWSGSVALRERLLRGVVRERLGVAGYVSARYHEALARVPVLSGESDTERKMRQRQALCMAWFMPVLQERVFAMCGGGALTVLTPYCDERLAQYVVGVPWRVKRMYGHEKGLLRAAARDLLPDALLWRKKSPYPKTYSPRYAHMVREKTVAMLADKNAPILELIDPDEVRALVESPLTPSGTPWFGQLMTGVQLLAFLTQTDDWMRRYRVEIDL